jgi:hypothetical protein
MGFLQSGVGVALDALLELERNLTYLVSSRVKVWAYCSQDSEVAAFLHYWTFSTS